LRALSSGAKLGRVACALSHGRLAWALSMCANQACYFEQGDWPICYQAVGYQLGRSACSISTRVQLARSACALSYSLLARAQLPRSASALSFRAQLPRSASALSFRAQLRHGSASLTENIARSTVSFLFVEIKALALSRTRTSRMRPGATVSPRPPRMSMEPLMCTCSGSRSGRNSSALLDR
jgi:hypothetical protein